MKKLIRLFEIAILLTSLSLAAQQAKPAGLLSSAELKQAAPASFFFRGQSAPAQLRNSAGIRLRDSKLVLAGLVDTAGYSSAITEKYQGFLITEVPISLEGSALKPGGYGFGFTANGKFVIMDVGANELLSVTAQVDDNLKRPVPLRIVEEGGAYRLYAGKKWVGLKVQ
jgi:hypothetical protein